MKQSCWQGLRSCVRAIQFRVRSLMHVPTRRQVAGSNRVVSRCGSRWNEFPQICNALYWQAKTQTLQPITASIIKLFKRPGSRDSEKQHGKQKRKARMMIGFLTFRTFDEVGQLSPSSWRRISTSRPNDHLCEKARRQY